EALADLVGLVAAERVDGGPITGAEHDVPEAVWPVEVVLAGGGHDGWFGSMGEQACQRGGGGDFIPWVERPDQGRFGLTDRLPEAAVSRPGPAPPPRGGCPPPPGAGPPP